ncbi:MAG TPA: LPS export ABC transporter permease LptG [Candidatus Binatia bacterium]|jgi:lipopolysaccharide export system permease protein
MNGRGDIKFLPVGGILDRYLVRAFLRVFFISLVCSSSLFLIVDCFDRLGTFLDAGASLSTIARYFFYTTPLSISRVIGFATLFSTLFSLGTLARTQEVTAMRASGLSIQRISLPILMVSLLICLVTFSWNEGLVPIFAHRASMIYKVEIKNRQQQSLFGTSDIWIRGEGSFINVDHFDVNSRALEGVTVLQINRDFSLRGLVQIPAVHWTGKQWESKEGVEWRFAPEGKLTSEKVIATPPVTETPDDLKLLAREPEEFSFFDLQKQIADMSSKGIDTRAYNVDLQTKLAMPFISPLMVLLAIPFAVRKQIAGVALSFGIAIVIGFGYWVLSAFCISLGHGGALSASIAAWVPTSIFSLIGIYFFTAEQ